MLNNWIKQLIGLDGQNLPLIYFINMIHIPRIGVVIPFKNAESWIREALDSIMGQTFQDFEVIAVNDRSTDKGSDIVKSYGHKIRYIDSLGS